MGASSGSTRFAPEAPAGLRPSGDDPAREWHLIWKNTAWHDGRDVILLADCMEVQARFCPGEWHDHHEGREYSGAVWSCFDDNFQIEIEETSDDPAEWWFGSVTHWRHLTPRPCDSDGSGEAVETAKTGSTEGDSAGRQASPTPRPSSMKGEG